MSSLIKKHGLGQSITSILAQLDPTVFAHPARPDILHLCVVQYLDGLRQGSANTKTRAEVRGSGRKLRPQKGSGRARLGDRGSPMLRGGGVAHGPKPRDFSTKLNRKVIEMGMRVALSTRARERTLSIVPSLEWPNPKTQSLVDRLADLQWRKKTLFVTGHDEVPSGLDLAARNVHYLDTITARELNVYNAVRWPHLVLDLAAVEHFEKTLSKLPKPILP
ncbi:ribosomal protein L4 [Vararia minispora EC-137]|uniref:Ribosomal protein L4 n=1 Tax=Vararia minispora EC-137 TaxID=1314806 RepID=A0ACB8QMX7_9AGAM|nr:ribosomal protein L4 [Vararia minispora EC-137]